MRGNKGQPRLGPGSCRCRWLHPVPHWWCVSGERGPGLQRQVRLGCHTGIDISCQAIAIPRNGPASRGPAPATHSVPAPARPASPTPPKTRAPRPRDDGCRQWAAPGDRPTMDGVRLCEHGRPCVLRPSGPVGGIGFVRSPPSCRSPVPATPFLGHQPLPAAPLPAGRVRSWRAGVRFWQCLTWLFPLFLGPRPRRGPRPPHTHPWWLLCGRPHHPHPSCPLGPISPPLDV